MLPEDVAKVFYFYLCKCNYDKANEQHISEVHQFKSAKSKDCNVQDITIDAQETNCEVSFIDPVNKKKVRIDLEKKNDSWKVYAYSSVSESLKVD